MLQSFLKNFNKIIQPQGNIDKCKAYNVEYSKSQFKGRSIQLDLQYPCSLNIPAERMSKLKSYQNRW